MGELAIPGPPYITRGSEVVQLFDPPAPVASARSGCPHLRSGLSSWHDSSTWPGGRKPHPRALRRPSARPVSHAPPRATVPSLRCTRPSSPSPPRAASSSSLTGSSSSRSRSARRARRPHRTARARPRRASRLPGPAGGRRWRHPRGRRRCARRGDCAELQHGERAAGRGPRVRPPRAVGRDDGPDAQSGASPAPRGCARAHIHTRGARSRRRWRTRTMRRCATCASSTRRAPTSSLPTPTARRTSPTSRACCSRTRTRARCRPRPAPPRAPGRSR